MKCLLLSFALCFGCFICNAQQRDTIAVNDPLQKSKRLRTAGIVMAAGGFVLTNVSRLVLQNEELDFDGALGASFGLLAGSLTMLGSIPLFISSIYIRRKVQRAHLAPALIYVSHIKGSAIATGRIAGLRASIDL